MSDIVISVTGLSELLSQASNFSAEIQEEIDAEIIDFVMIVNGKQRKLAPVDQGGLRRGIGFERKHTATASSFDMYSNAEQSGYMEFGTRTLTKVPPGLESVAGEMKGAGIKSKLKAKEAIYAWCKRVGINKKYWWWIFMKIMSVGVRPHPFFFQPFFDESPKLIARISKILGVHSGRPVVIPPGEFTRNNIIKTI